MEWSTFTDSPEILRLWSGLTCLGGAAERRICTRNKRGPLYPNLFTLLVAPPAVGKSQIITQIHRLWALTGKLNIASPAVTKAGLIDTLADGQRQLTANGEYDRFHSVLVASSEFGVLVPAHDLAFLNTLNQLYDCESRPFGERSRTRGQLSLDNPHMALLAGTQPKYLAELLPDTAFGMGTTSRLVMVYAGEQVRAPLFSDGVGEDAALFRKLLLDLTAVADAAGEIVWERPAATAFDEWQMAGGPPAPGHSKLISYSGRRPVVVIKLCMIFALSEGRGVVTRAHFDRALATLLAAESVMTQIFKEMLVSDHAALAEELYNFVLELWLKHQKPVAEHIVIRYLQDRVPANTIQYHVQAALDSHRLISQTTERPFMFTPNLD